MKPIDVVLISQREYISPKVNDEYHRNILLENQLLQTALDKYGLIVKRVGWDDPDFDWTSTKCAIIRETWDYFHRIVEFKVWLNKVKSSTQLINPYEQILWNIDKHYLYDLTKKGVNIPDTMFVEAGDGRSLKELHAESNWNKIVLKPAVSGSGRHTYLLEATDIQAHEGIYSELIDAESMLLQRFQDHVVEHGEWTFVVIGGKYTHGILKKAKAGEFRVQGDFGGSVMDYDASPKQILFAEKVMKLIEPMPIYGRIDVILDQNGEMAVQEVELIEPELWFRNCPTAADKLATEVNSYLNSLE